jgi:hypothetical protein
MKITKVHRVLEFKQKPWLKEYIDFNTSLRSQATSEFERDFFKLMNNAVFGKFLENVRNRTQLEITVKSEDHGKRMNYARCQRDIIFNENVVGVALTRNRIELCKPILVGACILELSKVHMYDFHYNTMRAKYGDKCKLLFTDTDSLMYEIETDDVYADLESIKNQFDFSNYPKDHPLYSTDNMKVVYKFKDETGGVVILEFAGLKPKMYSFITADASLDVKRNKGAKKSVVANKITHQNYVDCLNDDSYVRYDKQNSIRSVKHQIFSMEVNKITLDNYDDKRFYCSNTMSRSHGHYLNKIHLKI